MDQSIRLNQRQINKLVLTQGMRQSIQMLQLDAVDLDAYLKDVAESNLLLKYALILSGQKIHYLAQHLKKCRLGAVPKIFLIY
ncbi:hypothetical protein [Lacticaseibacillus paracasei]|uniref:hypothetical protein n=1 Tax=Lacticaseibacillus paracasei TaxID=1597 RepID=UPI002478243C|nr:hypothetical protein [Lacticaseibacillus paracasei]MDH7443943.1 hypothetical protein [Lacticaseibacillus paracasei subsp. paracasei]